MQYADRQGLVLAMLPTWGYYVKEARTLTAANARAYGRWLGQRYKDAPNVVWVNGGDRTPPGFEDVFRELARGLREGDGGLSQTLGDKKIYLGNIKPRRDFLFVKDTVRGFIELEKCNEGVGKVDNIGTGIDISIEDLVKKVLLVTGQQLEIKVEDRRIRPQQSEVMQLLSDTRLAQELFQWAPRYTLEEGLRETMEWYQKNLSRFKIGSYPL